MTNAPNDAERSWFEDYLRRLDEESTIASGSPPYACPCCGYLTLGERGGFDICRVCFWEDDGQDGRDADVVRGGPNGGLSLTAARASYRRIGACEERFLANVRPPSDAERPS